MISECRHRPQQTQQTNEQPRQKNQTALQAQVNNDEVVSSTASSTGMNISPNQIQDIFRIQLIHLLPQLFRQWVSLVGHLIPLSTFSSPSSPAWFMDSGVSKHMTSIAHSLKDLVPYDGHEQIIASNGQTLSISGIGSIGLSTPQNQSLKLSKVFFVPHLFANLVSVGQLVENGYSLFFPYSGLSYRNSRLGR